MRTRPRVLLTVSLVTIALLALAIGVVLAGSSGSSGGSGPGVSSGGTAGSGFDGGLLPAGLAPHEFTLTDQYGRRIRLSELRGRVVILAFLYSTSKTTAPLIAQQIRGALDELEPHRAKDSTPSVPALAVSVDPAADTPAHVRAFLQANSLTGRLEYLTGTPAQLRAVWRAYTVIPASAGPLNYERGAFVLLLDKRGAERVEFSLESLTPEGLAHDVRELQGE
jgi:protein SCO1/2